MLQQRRLLGVPRVTELGEQAQPVRRRLDDLDPTVVLIGGGGVVRPAPPLVGRGVQRRAGSRAGAALTGFLPRSRPGFTGDGHTGGMVVTRRGAAVPVLAAVLAAVLLAACGIDEPTAGTAPPETAPPETAPPETTQDETTQDETTQDETTQDETTQDETTVPAAAGDGVENVWSGATVDLTALPLGDGSISTTGAGVGALHVCTSGRPGGLGAHTAGPWIDQANGTWDSTTKVKVQGEVSWPQASYLEQVEADQRVIVTNNLPTQQVTGTFPIAVDDPAFQYDRNPNAIAEQTFTVSLPAAPTVADRPSCLPRGAIGVLRNGVYLFAAVDEANRDAVAWETQDLCDGHPEQSGSYHYHGIPSCLIEAASGPSTVVGFALDGFPIVVERDAEGNLPTNADLDECHGRTSPILLDGEMVETYHYSATLEFPYVIGCFRGTPVSR
ncbi:MAG: YHYH protein [Actinobacteria bacterium]|uniref:Unannotated protein n=1 Tax=freshwater metagenome TaxID=449393 RepID=A0A6J6BNX4_9ZZZZ|nr:YHYH protein [Actinomycetota bacterium]